MPNSTWRDNRSRINIHALFRWALAALWGAAILCGSGQPELRASATARTNEAYGRLPLSFEANRGQFDQQVAFLARGHGYNLFLTATEAVFSLQQADEKADKTPNIRRAAFGNGNLTELLARFARPRAPAVLRMQLAGANAAPRLTGLEELPGKVNYFLGNDARRWRTDVPTYARVQAAAVYPGIDLVYYGNQDQLEYDFVVAPGADPQQIALRFAGAERVEIDAQGELVLQLAGGAVRQRKPFIYQETPGGKREISGHYVHKGDAQVGFQLGAYDVAQPLVIDPVLVYATYLGGGGAELTNGVVVDAAGNAYVTGSTQSADFPTANPLKNNLSGSADAFIAKLNAAGNALVYATYLGGGGQEVTSGIALDAAGTVYVTGGTTSTNFPAVNAAQTAFGGGANCNGSPCPDAFLAKLNAAGNALAYATYLGGNHMELFPSVTVDAAGNAYLKGPTASPNFPLRNAAQATFGGGANCGDLPCFDAFVTRINTTAAGAASLVYSTYLGGNRQEFVSGLAADAAGNVYLAGTTSSPNLPTRNGLSNTLGDTDAFVAKLNTSAAGAASLVYSTYLGGGSVEVCGGLALDAAGNVYVAGFTEGGFPLRNAAQTNFGGGDADVFVAKLNPNATGAASLVYASYLGGGGAELATGLAVDAAGKLYVAGLCESGFPLRNAAQTNFGGGEIDAFVAQIDTQAAGAASLIYSTYLGGSGDELSPGDILDTLGFNVLGGESILIDAAGNAYVTGLTDSTNFPLRNPSQPGYGGGAGDVYAVKLNPGAAGAASLVYATYVGGGGQDLITGMALDTASNLYLVGITDSSNFPTAGPVQPRLRGGTDAFLAKLAESGGPPVGAVASVSAASYQGAELAPDSIAAAFGAGLATRVETATSLPLPTQLAGTSLKVRDGAGVEQTAALFFVAPGQINYHIPAGLAAGNATVTVTSGAGQSFTGAVRLARSAPGVFTADASGQGFPAAVVLRLRADGTQVFEPVARFDQASNRFVAIPIEVSLENELVFLVLFGTGFRYAPFGGFAVNIGGANGEVFFYGATTFVGLDQCNVRLGRELAGRGEVNVVVTAEGKAANTVRVSIK